MKNKEEISAIKKVTEKNINKINLKDVEEEQLNNLSNVELDEIIDLLYLDVIKIEQNKIMSVVLYKELGELHKKLESFKKLLK